MRLLNSFVWELCYSVSAFNGYNPLLQPVSVWELCGYDAYLPAVSPEKNVVILNRGKLVIGENNEQEKFIDFNERGI